MQYVPYYVSGFTLAVMLARIFAQPAAAFGLVDIPGGRKRHGQPVPLIGGLTMFVAFLVVVAALWPFPSKAYASLIAGMALLVIVGAIDDKYELNTRPRLLVQIAAALILTLYGDIRVTHLGDILGFGNIELGAMAIPYTVICVVAFINAINMLDGFDGLAGGIVMVALIWLAIFTATAGINHNASTLMIMLAATVAGFLTLNMRSPWRKQAKVFMGDAGSTMLGFAIAWFAIYIANQTGETGKTISPMAIAWILALPTYDTVTVMARRIKKGRSPFSGGRDHMHHILLRAGLKPNQVFVTMIALAIAGGGFGYFGHRFGMHDTLLFVGFIATGFVHLWFSISGWKSLNRLRAIRAVQIPNR